MLLEVVWLIVGLIGLYFAAEYLVKGASNLAFQLGVTPLVIGLTVVAFGTSAPELVVTVDAALSSESSAAEVSLGNILGSNVCNIGLILGVAALIRPLHVDQASLRRDYPVMLASSALLWLFCYTDQAIARWEGAVLFAGILGFVGYNFHLARRDHQRKREAEEEAGVDAETGGRAKNIAFVLLGLGGLAVAADLVVSSAISIATVMGISPFVIAVSVVAFGTSLPELATSAVAAVRGDSDISVGNVVGSNIFNVLLILGLVPMIFGLAVREETLTLDFPIMVGFSALLYPIMRTGFHIGRIKGGLLLACYLGYVGMTVMTGPS